jgi:hypothetical protein
MVLKYHDSESVSRTASALAELLARCRALQERLEQAEKDGVTRIEINHEKRRTDALEFFAMWLDDGEARLNRACRGVAETRP